MATARYSGQPTRSLLRSRSFTPRTPSSRHIIRNVYHSLPSESAVEKQSIFRGCSRREIEGDHQGRNRETSRSDVSVKFCDLLKCLQPITGKGSNGAAQVAEVISMLTSVPEDRWNTPADPSTLATEETRRKIFTSDTAFTKKLANAMYECLNLDNFISAIDEHPIPAKEQVLANLGQHGITGIDLYDLGSECARIAQDFLISKAKIAVAPQAAERAVQLASAKSKNRSSLYLQARGCASCQRDLSVPSGSDRAAVSELVLIDANCPEPGFNDFVVMCPQCATSYSANASQEEQTKMADVKQNLVKQEELFLKATAPLRLESEITALLEEVSRLSSDDLDHANINRNYDPVDVDAKITQDVELLLEVRDAMTNYYATVESRMKNLDDQDHLNFQLLSNDMRGRYLELQQGGNTQAQVFDQLTSWVQQRTNKRQRTCAIFVSYFVQICEVFDAPTK